MLLTEAKLRELVEAAFTLGLEGQLLDPSDDDVLIYSAESIGSTLDLAKLEPLDVRTILDAYDRGTGL